MSYTCQRWLRYCNFVTQNVMRCYTLFVLLCLLRMWLSTMSRNSRVPPRNQLRSHNLDLNISTLKLLTRKQILYLDRFLTLGTGDIIACVSFCQWDHPCRCAFSSIVWCILHFLPGNKWRFVKVLFGLSTNVILTCSCPWCLLRKWQNKRTTIPTPLLRSQLKNNINWIRIHNWKVYIFYLIAHANSA